MRQLNRRLPKNLLKYPLISEKLNWTNSTYLRYRAPPTIFSSPCITFPMQHFRNSLDYLDFTARAIYAMCEFNKMIENDEIPVGTLYGFDLDNSQFQNVFGTVRIPQRSCDFLQQCPSNYVVVIHKNNVNIFGYKKEIVILTRFFF